MWLAPFSALTVPGETMKTVVLQRRLVLDGLTRDPGLLNFGPSILTY